LWSAIYRRDFVAKNNLDFSNNFDDAIFTIKAVILANRIELVENTYYRYIRRKDSLDSEKLSIEVLKSSIDGANIAIDFINDKISNDKEAYNIIFREKIWYLLYDQYSKSCTIDGCLALICGAIELYKKCKHKDDLNKVLTENHAKFLSEGNEVALFVDLLEYKNKVVCFKLFRFIPLLKIIYRRYHGCGEIMMILFRWIPLLKVEKKCEGDYYYLFSCLPVAKKEKKK
jgi:hypothetical protein